MKEQFLSSEEILRKLEYSEKEIVKYHTIVESTLQGLYTPHYLLTKEMVKEVQECMYELITDELL